MTTPEFSVQLLKKGYTALTVNVNQLGQDGSYLARMLGRRALVVWGADGARLFYDGTLVQRAGVVPPPLARLRSGKEQFTASTARRTSPGRQSSSTS